MRRIALLAALVSLFQFAVVRADDLQPAGKPIAEVIDHYLAAGFQEAKIQPARQAAETTVLRRSMLDLVGRIPASIEVREYLTSKDPQKRTKLVERLIKSDEYVEHQSYVFDNFIANGNGGIRNYLKTAIQENRTWDRVFRDILIGDPKDKKTREASAFLVARAKDIDRLTNDVSIVFFGVNVSCAKCHDHPLVDDWKQDHFYGMKSFFNRTFASGKYVGERAYGEVSYKTTKGESRDAKLMFLTGTVIKEPNKKKLSAKERKKLDAEIKRLMKQKKQPPMPKNSRRKKLVELALKSSENRFFAKAIVNRIWHQYMGYGLVMPLDQMHSANPPSHPELLSWLERDFVAHGYDLQRLVKGIVLSKAYARSSRWETSAERPGRSLFAVAEVKPLTPNQLARSLSLASADPESFADEKMKPADRMKRIVQSASNRHANKFEQPGENFQVSADEALFFTNSPDVQRTYLNGGLVRRLEQISDDGKAIETAVQAVLSRMPTAEERKLLAAYVAARKDRRKAALSQVVWSLMTSSEFRFNY